MNLTETGESRLNGYLFVLERSLKTFLPADTVRDAVREIESHLRERVAAADAAPDERTVLERILAELGTPLHVAQAYAAERVVDEAVVTGRIVPIVRAIWQVAASTVVGFIVAVALFAGYAAGCGFLLIAAMKPIFPSNVGLIVVDGVPRALGAVFPIEPGATVVGGYWIVPIAAACGIAVLVVTHRAARGYLARWRGRRRAQWQA